MLRRRAFTLTEILIVLGILALLSAILLPAFNMVRERGLRTSCQSNLHQLGVGIEQYLQDTGGHYFPTTGISFERLIDGSAGCPTIRERTIAWPVIFARRLHSEALFRCPSLSGYQELSSGDGAVPLWTQCSGSPPAGGVEGIGGGGDGMRCKYNKASNVSAYAYNIMLGQSTAWENTPQFKPGDGFEFSGTKESSCPYSPGTYGTYVHLGPSSQSRVVSPSNTILLAETEDATDGAQSAADAIIWNDKGLDYVEERLKAEKKERPEATYRLARRHNGGYNVLFADGHVKWLKYGNSKPSQWTVRND